MKVVCINNKELQTPEMGYSSRMILYCRSVTLTIGKVYDVIDTISDDNILSYRVKNDVNDIGLYKGVRFESLSVIRDRKLKELGI